MRSTRVHLVSSQAKLSNSPTIIASGTLSGSFTSTPVDIQYLEHWSATVVAQGVVGNAVWQVCNDLSPNEYDPTGLNTWVEYPDLSAPVSCSSPTEQVQTFWTLSHQGYAFVRFNWEHQAGTGSIDVSFTAKGG